MTFTSDNPNVLKVFAKKISSLGNIFLKAFTIQILLQKRPFEPPSQLIKEETPAQVFSCEFWDIFDNTSFKEHFQTTAFIAIT